MYQHNRRSWVLLTSLATCAALATTPAFAAERRSSLKLMQVGDMQYMSGGVNKKERDVLEHRSGDFRVRVRFEGASASAPVGEVSVTLVQRDEGNAVIRLKIYGPVLLMSLPAGRYTMLSMTPGSAESVQSQFELLDGKNEQLRVVLNAPAAGEALAASTSNRL